MANNYSSACFIVPVKDAALTTRRLEAIAEWFDADTDDPLAPSLPADLFNGKASDIAGELDERRREYGALGFNWIMDGDRLYFEHDESIDMESAVLVAQVLLDLDDNDAIVTATWADTCSSTRADEFGGGAVAFNRHTAEWNNTYDMARLLADKVAAAPKGGA